MGKIKEIYVQLKREYPNWDEEDFDYLFKKHVRELQFKTHKLKTLKAKRYDKKEVN